MEGLTTSRLRFEHQSMTFAVDGQTYTVTVDGTLVYSGTDFEDAFRAFMKHAPHRVYGVLSHRAVFGY